MTITREQAAERRAEQMPAPASRPMQRRLGEDALSRAGAVLVATIVAIVVGVAYLLR